MYKLIFLFIYNNKLKLLCINYFIIFFIKCENKLKI